MTSITASQWPLSRHCAGLVLDPAKIRVLGLRGPPNIFNLLGVNWLAFEMDNFPGAPMSELARLRVHIEEIETITGVISREKILIVPKSRAADMPSEHNQIIAPQNRDELFDLLTHIRHTDRATVLGSPFIADRPGFRHCTLTISGIKALLDGLKRTRTK